MRRPRLLLSGASGHLGTSFIRLYRDAYDIHAIVRPGTHVPDGCTAVTADLFQPLSRQCLPSEVDSVIHLAQARHYRDFPEKSHEVFQVNVAATMSLLEYARQSGVRHFVLASSGSIYRGQPEPITENGVIDPRSFYALSKYQAEQLTSFYERFMTCCCLRFFFIYGPGQRKRLVPGIIAKVQRGIPVPIEGARGIRFNPIHVDDAARCLHETIARRAGGAFNIAGTEILDIRSMTELIGRLVGKTPVFRQSAPAALDLIADTRKAQSKLALTCLIPAAQGFKTTVEIDAPSLALSD